MLIRREEVPLLQSKSIMYYKNENQKPLVVSMGDYAASGGYYISAIADKIIAQPNTITGSIGILE